MTLLMAAIAPAVFLLIMFYKIDKYNPEPPKLLIKLYFLGIVSVIPIIILEMILSALNVFQFFETDLSNLYEALIVAGFSEEIFKWGIVFVFAYKHKAYDEHLDGIIYCVFVSLGFATLENIFYVFEGSYSVAIIRAILSVPAHMLFGVTMGYYMSLSKFSYVKSQSRLFMFKSLLIPILLHGAYDYFLMSKYHFLLLGFIPFMIWMWLFNMKRLRKYYNHSKHEHLDIDL